MARTNRPTVQAEKIRDREGLQATVRSQSVYTYDEKRPDYIERPDDLRSNPWMQLSRSLAEFDDSLSTHLVHRAEAAVEEGVSKGAELFSADGTDPTTGNKLAWKEFAERNPDKAGLNPHLQTGYEAARLKSLALDYKAGLQDAYSKNGLVNETDASKVAQFADQYDQEFRKTHGLAEYEDKLLMAEHFSRNVFSAKQSVLARHNEDFARENVAKAQQEYGQLFSKMVNTTIDDLNVNFADPVSRERLKPALADAMSKLVAEASLNGLPTSAVQSMVVKAFVTTAQERGYTGHGDEILDLMEDLDFGAGKLADIPEAKSHIETMRRSFIEQERADKNWEDAQREKRLRDAERGAVRLAASLGMGDVPVTAEMLRSKGVDPLFLGSALRTAEAVRKSREVEPVWDAATTENYARLKLRILRGEASDNEVVAAAGVYGKAIDQLLDLHTGAQERRDRGYTEALKSGGNRVFSLLTGKNVGDSDDILSQLDGTADPKVKTGLEAMQLFGAVFETKYAEAVSKKNGAGFMPSELEYIRQQAMDEVLKRPQFGIFKPDPVMAPSQAQAPADPVQMPQAVRETRLLGSSDTDFKSAVQEFAEAKDKRTTRLMQVAAAQGVTTPEALQTFLMAQGQLYSNPATVQNTPGIDPSLAIHQNLYGKFTWYSSAYDAVLQRLSDDFNLKKNIADSKKSVRDDITRAKTLVHDVKEGLSSKPTNRRDAK